MFGLVVRFSLEPDAGEAFDRLADEALRQIRQHEPGTLIYACHQDTEDSNVRVFYELYRDRAAFEEHERQEYIQHFLAEREQYLTGVRVEFLALQSGKGVPSSVSA